MCTSTAQNCHNRKCVWRGDRITRCLWKKLAAQPCEKRFCVGGESVQPNVGHVCGNAFESLIFESNTSEVANECGCAEINKRERREVKAEKGVLKIDWDGYYDPAWFVDDQRWFTGTKLVCKDRLYYIGE